MLQKVLPAPSRHDVDSLLLYEKIKKSSKIQNNKAFPLVQLTKLMDKSSHFFLAIGNEIFYV